MRNYSVSQIFSIEKIWGSLNPIAIGSQGAAVVFEFGFFIAVLVDHFFTPRDKVTQYTIQCINHCLASFLYNEP